MNINTARTILKEQDKSIRKLNGMRFIRDGYEYRLTYVGGFSNYVAIDRRKVGTRNFKFFGGIGSAHCKNAEDAYNLVLNELDRRKKAL